MKPLSLSQGYKVFIISTIVDIGSDMITNECGYKVFIISTIVDVFDYTTKRQRL